MRTLLLFILIIISTLSFSQEQRGTFSGSLVASFSMPTGEFKTVYGKGALGANLSVLNRFETASPVAFGVEVGYHYLDGDSYYYSTPNTSYEKFATTNLVSVFPKFRIQHPGSIAFSPFAEAMIGANFFYAHEKVIAKNYYYGETKERRIKELSAKPGFAFAAGFNIPVSKTGERLEIKSMYMLSGRTSYFGDPTYSATGDLTFSTMRSRTDMLMFQVGINL